MLYVFIFVVGTIFGMLFERILIKSSHIGILRIDNSDGDGPYLFLELSKSVSAFNKRKRVIMSVKEENYISHE